MRPADRHLRMLNRFQPLLLHFRPCTYIPRSRPPLHLHLPSSQSYIRSFAAMAAPTPPAPVASSSHPAQITALDAPHANNPEPKKAKDKKAKIAATSEHPLEVCTRLAACLTKDPISCSTLLAATASRVFRSPHQDFRQTESRVR